MELWEQSHFNYSYLPNYLAFLIATFERIQNVLKKRQFLTTVDPMKKSLSEQPCWDGNRPIRGLRSSRR